MITKGERGAEGFEREGWAELRAGDKAVEVSVGVGIVRHLIRNGGKVCSLTINCVAHNL